MKSYEVPLNPIKSQLFNPATMQNFPKPRFDEVRAPSSS